MGIGLLAALLIGLSLGLLGSGGSILTVPVLVYLLEQPEKVAIAGSLVIVGGIALVSSLSYLRAGQVDGRSVLWFGLPGMAGTWVGAMLSAWISGTVQLLLFATVMLAAAVLMARPPKLVAAGVEQPLRSAWKIGMDGLLVGILTGLVGVGGGFMIVPALVLLGGLSMRVAVGTSLLVIALKSLSGAIGYWQVLPANSFDWPLIGMFILIGAVGGALGERVSSRIPQAALRKGFAVFLVVMAIAIFWKNLA
ncbi:MAG: sulfite exporter TauE/SafE family protein [Gammaproteobacteria bacterium]|nr:sulfite exporter TauE/SafE family protein [Gammaproteobacteria bacterium]